MIADTQPRGQATSDDPRCMPGPVSRVEIGIQKRTACQAVHLDLLATVDTLGT